MIYTVTLNPAVDKTAVVESFTPFGLNRLSKVKVDAGGKGINVSKTIHAMGQSSIALGFVAGTTGKFICDELARIGVTTNFIETTGNTRTNLKILDKDMRLTELNEQGDELSQNAENELIDKVTQLIGKDDILVLSGSIPSGISVDIYKKLINASKEKGAISILDADGKGFANGIVAQPYLCKPNQIELSNYFALSDDCGIDVLIEKSKTLLNEGTKCIVLSCGENGAIYVTKDKVLKSPALKIDLKSSVGAGDAMVAAIAVSLEQKDMLEEMVRLSMAVGAGACETQGTEPPSKERLEFLKEKVTIEKVDI